MNKQIKQLDPAEWPGAKTAPVALLAMPPEELAKRSDLVFSSEHDDLDDLLLAVVQLSTGDVLGLLRYKNSPNRATEVFAYADDAKNAPSAVLLLLNDLGLSPEVLTALWDGHEWISGSALFVQPLEAQVVFPDTSTPTNRNPAR